jgi:hypothetical protein
MTLNTTTTGYRPVSNINRTVAMVLGGILLLVGLLGFVMDPILGIFEVDALHNVVHLLTGGILLAAAFLNNGEYVRTVNITLGVVYLLVALLGFIAPAALGSLFQFNMADNWLHVLLGVVLVGAGFADRTRVDRPTTGAIR